MKNVLSMLFAIVVIASTVSCDKDQAIPLGPEEALIEHITTANKVDLLAPQDVPSQVISYVASNFRPYQIEMVYEAHGYGLEVMLENGMCIFFDDDGEHINHDGLHDDWSNMHGDDYNCMMGDHMDLDMCPGNIQNYIHEHYPNQAINELVVKPSGKLSIALEDKTVLMFNPATGELVTECYADYDGGGMGMGMGNEGHHMHDHGYGINASGLCDDDVNQGGDHPWGPGGMMGHGGQGGDGACWGGASIELGDIPVAIATYVDQNYPESELLFVMQNYHGNYMLRLEDCVRLVFDENGNLLFDSGN